MPELKEMQHAESLGREGVAAIQETLLSRLVTGAYRNVPYYQDSLEAAGVVAGGSVHLDQFRRLPVLTKDTLRREGARLHSSRPGRRKWRRETSGGTTGEPVVILHDEETAKWFRASKHLFDQWSGYSWGQPKAVIWGSERDILGGGTVRRSILRYARNELWLNAFQMTPADVRRFLEELQSFEPMQLLSYAESGAEVARLAEEMGVHVPRLRTIMTSAGMLFPEMRELLTRVFRCPVFDRYGSREVGDIACQRDPSGPLVVCPLTHFVEVLADDGAPAMPGMSGRLVVTQLTNTAMPLIRYEIGDVATAPEIDDRGWQTIDRLQGRITEVFVTLAGGRVSAEYFTHLLYFQPWCRQFQVIQERLDAIRVLYVRTEPSTCPMTKDIERELTSKVRAVMGPTCEVTLEEVSSIARAPSGKRQFTLSRLPRGSAS